MSTAFNLGISCSLLAITASPALGQTAPYVLPYTMSTFAGSHAAYTPGAACGNGVGIALDAQGDGCLASQVSVGVDPHDIRVDPRGNIYWIDNTSSNLTYIHKISAYGYLQTVFVGSNTNTKVCTGNTDTYGDGCPSTDGAANNNTAVLTTGSKFKNQRGLGTGLNGDVFSAGYNDYNIHRIFATPPTPPLASPNPPTGLMVLAAGISATTTATTTTLPGPVATSGLGSSRGVGVDAAGNIYIADTGNNILQEVVGGQLVPVTANNSAAVKYAGTAATATVAAIPGVAAPTGVPASGALLNAPEDAQIDSFGNIFIADAGNNLVRAIYVGGTLPGISNPVVGYIYTIAGDSSLTLSSAVIGGVNTNLVNGSPNTTYPSDGSTPTVSPTSVALTVRKLSLDKLNNLYIADSSNEVVWFIDHLTGKIRLLAGSFGGARPGVTVPAMVVAQPSVALGCPASPAPSIGDGCPGSYSSISAASDMGAAPDNQGNLYITDAQIQATGTAAAATSRLRELLSGLNFPTLAINATPVTQNVLLHFGPTDKPAAAGAYTFASANSDFKLGTATCTLQADTTTDCVLPISFSPTQAGNDATTLIVKTNLGATASFVVTGGGIAPTIAFDPGSITLSSASTKAAQAIALDGAGNAYIADTGNNRILFRNALTDATTVFAGTGSASYSGDGGAATSATLNAPRGVTIDTTGSVYIADTGNKVIRKVDASGRITTYAGGASTVCAQAVNARGDNCPGTGATFSSPTGLAADNAGQIFVSDTGNNVIRQISLSGYVSTLAGGASTICAATASGGTPDTLGNGCSALSAIFLAPTAIAYDAPGQNLIVADTGNNVVRKIGLNNNIVVKSGVATAVVFNPVTLIAGNGQAGSSVSITNVASLSQLNGPTGVAVDPAGNVYIADTGNSSIRLVNANGGLISTIAGILGASGTSTPPGSAVNTQLNAPAAVSVNSSGTLIILDSGNNRVLSDTRSQITYDFGRINVPTASPLQNFTELNIGVATTNAVSPLFTASGATTQFTLVAAANSSGTISACGSTFASGAICNLQAQFTPLAVNPYSATYVENGTGASGAAPSITLAGTGATLTKTTSAVAQTSPATGNSQFGNTLTLTATITPATCNAGAPSCFPSGSVTFVVDGVATAPVALGATGAASQIETGLSVGSHIVSCNYTGDNFYAASTCANTNIIVGLASTTSKVTFNNNNQPQFTPITLTATVVSNTIGIPTGTVTFFANGTSLGTSSLGGTTGVATLTLQRQLDINGNVTANTTLLPGAYSITCTYNGAANYAASNCAAASFTVAPQPADFALVTRGCAAVALYLSGTSTPGQGVPCSPGPENTQAGLPLVTVAQGSTTDATIFINANNTAGATYTFSCSGLPAASTCTFAPTSVVIASTTGTLLPVPVDMTLWTDLQPGTPGSASLARPSLGGSHISLAAMLGWPLSLIGLAGIIRFRRKAGSLSALSLMALLLMLTGSPLVFSGCGSGGPGAYVANLTPAGTYPIVVTVKNGTVTHTTTVYWKVTSPGITGQQ